VTDKQKQLSEKHGTPGQFEKAIWKAWGDLFITSGEADAAIKKYRAEWDAAGTGVSTSNAPLSRPSADAAGSASSLVRCPSCGNELDPDVCWCGDEIKMHNRYRCGHNPVPLGCTCGYDKQPQPPNAPAVARSRLGPDVGNSESKGER
jgi:hypothetical protein